MKNGGRFMAMGQSGEGPGEERGRRGGGCIANYNFNSVIIGGRGEVEQYSLYVPAVKF